jgi:hypothetical protein
MRIFLRGLIGIVGVLAVLLALQFWLHPAAPAAKLGLSPLGDLGLSTIRADMAGFFGAAGVLALIAAIRNQGAWLTAPLLMVAIALTGRVVNVIAQGWSPDFMQPMAVEAVLVVLFAAGRRGLGSV